MFFFKLVNYDAFENTPLCRFDRNESVVITFGAFDYRKGKKEYQIAERIFHFPRIAEIAHSRIVGIFGIELFHAFGTEFRNCLFDMRRRTEARNKQAGFDAAPGMGNNIHLFDFFGFDKLIESLFNFCGIVAQGSDAVVITEIR